MFFLSKAVENRNKIIVTTIREMISDNQVSKNWTAILNGHIEHNRFTITLQDDNNKRYTRTITLENDIFSHETRNSLKFLKKELKLHSCRQKGYAIILRKT